MGQREGEYEPTVKLEHASVNRSEGAHRPVYDLLRQAPEMTLDQLFDAPELAGHGIDTIMQIVRFSLAVGETPSVMATCSRARPPIA